MSVYKEGYYAVKEIQKNSKSIYPDACDFGAPVRKGDVIWNWAKQLVDWYGVEDTRDENRYSTGRSVSNKVCLIDEQGTKQEEYFHICFVGCTDGDCKGYDGYIWVVKL